MAAAEATKLELFSEWLRLNGAQLRHCTIDHCGPTCGLGIFSSSPPPDDGVLMVVPLDLAITPMRVLQDPLLGPACADLYKQGSVDDRFLVILFLTVERLRPASHWKPYLDMLPTSFASPLWFTDDELAELKGTPLFRATILQKRSLMDLFETKARSLISEILHSSGDDSGASFEDFLWANSVFWSRALNIPFPRSYVFPQSLGDDGQDGIPQETVWAEGIVPGIDFCNHDLAAAAIWEVDGTGLKTGVPSSMYLLSVPVDDGRVAREVSINYGNKGNEELLYLYGFVMEDNKDDHLMLHYPVDAFQSLPFGESKGELLSAQKAELRCLLPRGLLSRGFYSSGRDLESGDGSPAVSGFSWSGCRGVPSYLDKLVFPAEFLTSLRTIAMSQEELGQVSTLLEELIGPDGEKGPSDVEVRSAVWEVCGDSGAFQLLVDLLQARIMDMEEGSGTEESDDELLKEFHAKKPADHVSTCEGKTGEANLSRNRWSAVVYRRGQKQLARLFLREAEHVLDLCLKEETRVH